MLRNRIFALAVALSGITFCFAQSGKVLNVKKISGEITVDGVVDPAWSQADSVADFVQYSPYWSGDPSRRTVARLLSTDEAMYCLIVCRDDRKNIQTNKGKLDDTGGDRVSLMLDSFGDRRTAYRFAVTASGVRSDCRMLDDARDRDYTWDGVWFSGARIYDWGYAVEMKIPYRAIQYDESLGEWGLDFDRWIDTKHEDVYWCRYAENEGQRISKFGRLVFEQFCPSVKGLNLEIYPVGWSEIKYLHGSKYEVNPFAGLDVFYNPSQRLTFQMTANPDFAQIEADPFTFNITRYESYYQEKRPFFTEGNEVFMPSGRERNSGFYRPLELFYPRRIGRKLSDGSLVPLVLGSRVFGRWGDWEYGGFLAATAEKAYASDGIRAVEPKAWFGSARIKKQIFKNSSVGLLYVGKNTPVEKNGVIDVDGAFRGSDWQIAYQAARSYSNDRGDFAGSVGFKIGKPKWLFALRSNYIGKDFDVSGVGFVPWKGTSELTALTGPRWYFKEGAVEGCELYVGPGWYYEKVDRYADRAALLGLNLQFRSNWGFEVNYMPGRARDQDQLYDFQQLQISLWFNVSPKWNATLNTNYSKTYNFSRSYLGYYWETQSQFEWRPADVLGVGASSGVFVEWKPDRRIEDITFNARPYFSLTPKNNLNVRVYVDNVYVRSTGRIEQVIGGFLFSYNFRPKSWIYLAINEMRDRHDEVDPTGLLRPNRLHVVDRIGVLKLKYLFYF